MEIRVVEGENIFNYNIDPTDTLATLKNTINIEEDLRLSDVMKDGNELDLIIDAPFKDKTATFKSTIKKTIQIVDGRTSRFKLYVLDANKKTKIRLERGKFGLVTHPECEEMGKRRYQADVYELKENNEVEFTEEDGSIEVIVNGEKQEAVHTKIYDEKSPSSPGMLSKVRDYSSILGNFGRFMDGVASIVTL